MINDNDANEPTVIESEESTDQLNSNYYFVSPTYSIIKSEFLEDVSAATDDALTIVRQDRSHENEIYPVYMSGPLFADPRMDKFCQYIASTGWNILDAQGYDMSNYHTTIQELWCQEHYKYSGMEHHVHGHGAQLIGFYFIETPEDSSRIVIHDPRPAKVQVNLPEKNVSKVTEGSVMVNFIPQPGMLFFANSWLPHSFTRNASDKPMRFIHFTIGVQYAPKMQQTPMCEPEII